MRARCTRSSPAGSRYSTPSAWPSTSTSTRTTLQCVRRSRLPEASASGTDVKRGFQRSLANGPKPPLHGWYAVAGWPLYGREFMQIGVG